MSERDPRHEHIYSMTGLWPDPRYRQPVTETVGNLRRYQAGDEAAGLALVRAKLVLIHASFATPEIVEETGHEAQDIMQMGVIKTLEVAQRFNIPKRQPAPSFTQAVTKAISTQILKPAMEQPLNQEELDALVESDRTVAKPSIEEEVFGNRIIAQQGLARALASLSAENVELLRTYHGIGRKPKLQAELARDYKITYQGLSLRIQRVYENIRQFELNAGLNSGMSAVLSNEDVANRGLIPSQDVPTFDASNFSK